MKKELTPLKADLVLLFVAFLWGSSYVVTKGSIDIIDPVQIIFFRFLIASVLSLIFFGRHLKTLSKGEMKAGFILGAMLCLGIIFALNGIKCTSVSKNSFIISTNVVVVPFLHWAAYRKKPTGVSIAAVFLMALGLGFLTLDFRAGFKINRGDLISFGSVFFYAAHLVFSDNYSKKYNPLSVNTIAMISVSFLSFVILLLTNNLRISIPGKIMGDMIYLAVFPTFLCYTLQLNTQKHTNATHAAIIISLESVFATLLAVLFLKEKITGQMAAGFAIIFISVLASELGETILAAYKEKYAKPKTEVFVNKGANQAEEDQQT